MFVNIKIKEKLLFADGQYNFSKMSDDLWKRFQQYVFHQDGNM